MNHWWEDRAYDKQAVMFFPDPTGPWTVLRIPPERKDDDPTNAQKPMVKVRIYT